MFLSTLNDGPNYVSRMLEELCASSVAPVGIRGALYAVIDSLRNSSAPPEQVDIAERISLTVLQLDWAIQKGDGEKLARVREELTVLNDRWHAAAAMIPSSAPEALEEPLELIEVESINEALERLNRRQK